MLAQIWRLHHPRLPEVLDAIGRGHPVKTVAKAARRALMQHRSRVGQVGRESMIGRRLTAYRRAVEAPPDFPESALYLR